MVARCARAPKGTKAASSDASGLLRLLTGIDPSSLRAASVTLMHRRGQPFRWCLLQREQCLEWLPRTCTHSASEGRSQALASGFCHGDGGQWKWALHSGCRDSRVGLVCWTMACTDQRESLTGSCAQGPVAGLPALRQPLSGAPQKGPSARPGIAAVPAHVSPSEALQPCVDLPVQLQKGQRYGQSLRLP